MGLLSLSLSLSLLLLLLLLLLLHLVNAVLLYSGDLTKVQQLSRGFLATLSLTACSQRPASGRCGFYHSSSSRNLGCLLTQPCGRVFACTVSPRPTGCGCRF